VAGVRYCYGPGHYASLLLGAVNNRIGQRNTLLQCITKNTCKSVLQQLGRCKSAPCLDPASQAELLREASAAREAQDRLRADNEHLRQEAARLSAAAAQSQQQGAASASAGAAARAAEEQVARLQAQLKVGGWVGL
jgi:hypothetical protein